MSHCLNKYWHNITSCCAVSLSNLHAWAGTDSSSLFQHGGKLDHSTAPPSHLLALLPNMPDHQGTPTVPSAHLYPCLAESTIPVHKHLFPTQGSSLDRHSVLSWQLWGLHQLMSMPGGALTSSTVWEAPFSCCASLLGTSSPGQLLLFKLDSESSLIWLHYQHLSVGTLMTSCFPSPFQLPK